MGQTVWPIMWNASLTSRRCELNHLLPLWYKKGELKLHRQKEVTRQQKYKYALITSKKKSCQVNWFLLTIMFSKECLANQQLRNTGMKRFLKAGKITCHNVKALILELPHHFTHTLSPYGHGQNITTFELKGGDKTPAYMCRWNAVSSNQSFSFFFCLTHSDHEGDSADHLQNKGDT